MKGSIERVRTLINGGTPDRVPMFDLLRNTAVISHFTGTPLTEENGAELVYKAYEPAIDATRPMVKAPNIERTLTLEDGREQKIYKWTTWTERRRYADSTAYEAAKRMELDSFVPEWTPADEKAMQARVWDWYAEDRRKLGDVFYFPGVPGTDLMDIYGEIGLQEFCYYLADCPDIIVELLERNTFRTIRWVEHLPQNHGMEAVFLGDDIAFNTGPLLNPDWMREHYFHRLARVIAAYHARGIKVLFHSDGNLNSILGDLVEAGIDGLNPIEVLAGMDVGDIHRRFPKLFMTGGIDVSQLLPFGTPLQVRDAVRKAIDEAEGRIMIGSSTELNDEVPLVNFLALRDTVLEG